MTRAPFTKRKIVRQDKTHEANKMGISVFGNIACGKSTLLRNLSRLGFEVFQEPVSDWKFLPKFYRSPERWCFALQIEILQSFSKVDCSDKIMERSAYEAYKIFATNSLNEGHLIKEEYDLIGEFSKQHAFPDKFVYIKLSPEKCHARLRKRARDCEMNVSLPYLENLHALYEKTVEEMRGEGMSVDVIDGDSSEEQILEQFMVGSSGIEHHPSRDH